MLPEDIRLNVSKKGNQRSEVVDDEENIEVDQVKNSSMNAQPNKNNFVDNIYRKNFEL